MADRAVEGFTLGSPLTSADLDAKVPPAADLPHERGAKPMPLWLIWLWRLLDVLAWLVEVRLRAREVEAYPFSGS